MLTITYVHNCPPRSDGQPGKSCSHQGEQFVYRPISSDGVALVASPVCEETMVHLFELRRENF
jgi:hypothetical protein